MVDINVRILQLPIEEARVELAKLEDLGYVNIILVYPVLENGEYDFPEIKEKFNILKAETKNSNLMFGNMVHYHSSILHRLKLKQISTLNDSEYLLLKLPIDEKPRLLNHIVSILSDYKLILYRPHECTYYNLKELVALKEQGVLFLITYEDTKNKIVRKLLKKKLIDFIVDGVSSNLEIAKKAKRYLDDDYSQKVVSENFHEINQKS